MSSNLSSRHQQISTLILSLLLLSSAMLLVGIFAPMMTLTKFVWIDNSFSLFAGTLQLFIDGQYFLFIILLTFSILLPVAKLILLLRFWYADSSSCDQLQNFMSWISHYGKWSMLDVFVVALLLVIVKLGALASVQVHYGIYMYAGAGLLIMLATTIISSIAKKDIENSLES
ncbi:MAG: paraquat-inducible protein A [Gammaproteobacteria bacterium]|nr:paraquat-inducible protein A [Gammaproteobacteria bacterium]